MITNIKKQAVIAIIFCNILFCLNSVNAQESIQDKHVTPAKASEVVKKQTTPEDIKKATHAKVVSPTKTATPSKKRPSAEDVKRAIMKRLGATIDGKGLVHIGKITIDPTKKEITFNSKLGNWNTEQLEVLICTPTGRAHETLLVADINPYNLQLALILLGAKNGGRLNEGELRQGSIINIDIQFLNKENMPRIPIENCLYNYKKNAMMERHGWVFVGSSFERGRCLANVDGNIANIWSFGNTILDNPEHTGDKDDNIRVYPQALPTYDFDIKVPYDEWKIPTKVFMTIKKR